MTNSISGRNTSPTTTAHGAPAPITPAKTTPATSFTRTQSPATALTNATFGRKTHPIAAPMTGRRTLDDARLKAMGCEILHLYQEKVIGNGGRRLAFTSDTETWSIRGADIGNILIHTKDGLIQLRPDGTPTRNVAIPIQSWEGLELGLSRALKTLREV